MAIDFQFDPERTALGTDFARGKTTPLKYMAIQDMYAGRGLGVIDPPGTSRAFCSSKFHAGVRGLLSHRPEQSHLVVQPTGASADDLQPAILTFHELPKEGVSKDRLATAICHILSDGEEETVRAYVQDAGYAGLPGAIPERIAYREARPCDHSLTFRHSRNVPAAVSRRNTEASSLLRHQFDLGVRRRGHPGVAAFLPH
jgi:hypothetical protein